MRPCHLFTGLVFAGLTAVMAFAAPSAQLKVRAERGEAAAQFELAKSILEGGQGGDQELAEGINLAELAATQGHMPAYELLASAYTSSQRKLRDIPKAVAYLRKIEAAGAVTPRVKALLGLLHYQGRGLPFDREKGAALIAASASAGDEAGGYFAQELKKRGQLSEILPMDQPEPALLSKAEEGDPEAQLEIAEAYFRGWIEYPEGTNPGKEWRERAAEGGSAKAQLFLAEGYLQGAYGYPKDAARGLRWLRRAADQGNSRALLRAGEIYFNGKAVPRDDKLAAQYLQRAMAAGVKEAEGMWGILLVEGRGTAANAKEGADLLLGAEKRGDSAARDYLLKAALAGKFNPTDAGQMQRLLEQGVKADNVEAMAMLGVLLWNGDKLPKNDFRARQLLQDAEKKGSAEARRFLLEAWVSGIFNFTDAAQAERLLDLGVRGRYAKAMAWKGLEFYQNRDKRPENLATGIAYLQVAARQGHLVAAGVLVEYHRAELKKLAGAGKDNDWTLRVYHEALFFYGRNGRTEDRLLAVRELTGFLDPDKDAGAAKVFRDLEDKALGALALIRIYQKEGGKDGAALGWLGRVEKFIRRENRKYTGGQTGIQLLDAKQAELEKFIADLEKSGLNQR
jgi:TPR repeat protein